MAEKGTILMPFAPKYPKQVGASWDVMEKLREKGYTTGLMLVMLDGMKGLNENIAEQDASLLPLKGEYGNAPLVVMLSCTPIEDIDFLHFPYMATKHVMRGVEFARSLPMGGRRIVSFHLNSLVSHEEFKRYSAETWRGRFSEIADSLSVLTNYARRLGVEIVIESTPAPEWGDLHPSDTRIYLGTPFRLLFNPLYLTSNWGFDEIHNCGAGICLDLCHNSTIYKSAQTPVGSDVLLKEDLEVLSKCSLMHDVLSLKPSCDIVHLNDGRGLFSFEGGVFEEGVALGEGDIPRLDEITRIILERNIPAVLEINEPGSDFIGRPEARKSVDYILQMNNA